MKISIERLKEIVMEEVSRATTEGSDTDWGMGKDEKSRTRPGSEDYTGHHGDESKTHPGETDYEDNGEDLEGKANRVLADLHDVMTAAGLNVNIAADVSTNGAANDDTEPEEEVEVELEDDA
jgi:hypothetical protein